MGDKAGHPPVAANCISIPAQRFTLHSPSVSGGKQRSHKMAKGMNKRKRDEKKPKKEKPKVIAAAPSSKDVVAGIVAKKSR